MAPSIPPEICETICTEVDPADLPMLCKTSRLFRDQVQRILYHTVDLGNCRKSRSLKSWCWAVTHNSRLAERVHTLVLRLPVPLDLGPKDVTTIRRALQACVNLKDLTVFPDKVHLDTPPESIDAYMMDELPFRLTKFTNSYFVFAFLDKFFTTQPDIQVVSMPCFKDARDREFHLPRLVAFGFCPFHLLPPRSPLQRLWTNIQPDISPLRNYSASLTSLHVNLPLEATISRTILSIVELSPGLMHLAITMNWPLYCHSQLPPVASLRQFSGLESFILVSQYLPPSDSPFWYHMHMTDEDAKDFGSALMKACPTLSRAVVGGPTHQFYTFTRTPVDASIHSESGSEFEFGDVYMSWQS
ncbi:hypothetical protein C8R46DRAFT_1103916 [Mycena filopes]|nr:hypothetical protein C8R46DRAFT_1103916 [Mycena filopes]